MCSLIIDNLIIKTASFMIGFPLSMILLKMRLLTEPIFSSILITNNFSLSLKLKQYRCATCLFNFVIIYKYHKKRGAPLFLIFINLKNTVPPTKTIIKLIIHLKIHSYKHLLLWSESIFFFNLKFVISYLGIVLPALHRN